MNSAKTAATEPANLDEQAVSEQQSDPLMILLDRPRAAPTPDAAPPASAAAEIKLGSILAIHESGKPLVEWPGGPEGATLALSLVPVHATDVGRQVALSFPNSSSQPLVLGLVWVGNKQRVSDARGLLAEIDGEQAELTAKESIVLRCGKASITLTSDGQILLRGAYISSHSTGTQRIKGASVRIN
jgi:hypothetical protein